MGKKPWRMGETPSLPPSGRGLGRHHCCASALGPSPLPFLQDSRQDSHWPDSCFSSCPWNEARLVIPPPRGGKVALKRVESVRVTQGLVAALEMQTPEPWLVLHCSHLHRHLR